MPDKEAAWQLTPSGRNRCPSFSWFIARNICFILASCFLDARKICINEQSQKTLSLLEAAIIPVTTALIREQIEGALLQEDNKGDTTRVKG